MTVTLDVTGNLYAYNGTLAQLGAVTVLPAFSTVGGTIDITDDDGTLQPGESSSISIGGAAQSVTYEGVASFNGYSGGLLGGLLGTLLGTTEATIFTTGSGSVYIYAPDGFPALAGVATTITLDDTASFDLSPSTDAVDGTSGDDVMLVGYTDADGDQITNHNPGGLFGAGYRSGNDEIYGYAGDDTISAGSGNDTVDGGSGDDLISGGAGADVLSGDTGDDTISGGNGNDTIFGGADNDSLSGESGADVIYGGDGDDTISGGLGRDTVYGGAGNDTWRADGTDSGTDIVYLEDGDDTAEVGYYTPADGSEIIDGGAGNDTIALDAPVVDTFDLGVTLTDDGSAAGAINFNTELFNFENVRGNSGDNALTGNSQANQLWGASGNDTLAGGAGNDTLDGGDDADTLDGGAGDDVLIGGGGADRMSGGDGDDRFVIGSAAQADGDVIAGGSGPDDTTDYDTLDLSALDRDSYSVTRIEDPNDSGALMGTVTFNTGEVLTYSGIEKIICFAAGTQIITSDGPVAIEDLEVGDCVMTMDNGVQPLRWIGSQKLGAGDFAASPKLKPIKISAGALGNGTPLNDLVVSRQHRILVRSAIAERMFGVNEILVAAIKLVGLPGVAIIEDAESVEYFHMLFDQHEIVFSNGAATESLFTGPEALKAVSEDSRAEILKLFPDIAEQTALLPVRPIPEKGAWVKRLVERHTKNNKALVS
jgi:Ca2+-binding RTX toxin-like protein